MKTMTSNNFMLLATILLGLTASCLPGQSGRMQARQDLPAPTKFPVSDIQEVQSSKGGRKFVRGGEGWELPQISWKSGQTTRREIEAENRRKTAIDQTEVDIRPFLVTAEPFASIGESSEKVQIQTARAFAVRNQVFCYKFLVNRVEIDNQTNAVRSSSGPLFFFAYYDEDGDGRFETLYLDEVGKLGVPSFYDLPHLPLWTWKPK